MHIVSRHPAVFSFTASTRVPPPVGVVLSLGQCKDRSMEHVVTASTAHHHIWEFEQVQRQLCKAVQPIREASVARFRAGLNLGGKVCERHIEYYMRCRIECLDTNKKINYIICQ